MNEARLGLSSSLLLLKDGSILAARKQKAGAFALPHIKD